MRLPCRPPQLVYAAWLLCAVASAQTVTITEYAVPTPSSYPRFLTAGPDGALWFTESDGNKIGRITTAGVIREYSLPTHSAAPWAIALGPDGALWFTETGAAKIGRITTAGAVTEFTTTAQPNDLWGIAAGSDGALWFTEFLSGKIGRITTTGAVTTYALPKSGSQPAVIVPASDGALWFTEYAGNNIGRITTAGVITEYPVPTPSSDPVGITAGPDGALWFTEQLGNHIGRITMAGVITEYATPFQSYPYLITAGPDGALWFTGGGDNSITLMTTFGLGTEYPVTTAGAGLYGITAGPDGALWFAELQANQIGRAAVSTGPRIIAPGALPGGALGTPYGPVTLDASGGAPPYTWSLAGGALPAGLTLSATGDISGSPAAVGTASFTAMITDTASATATHTMTITITSTPALTITAASLAGGAVGVAYSASLQASGGALPYTWSIAGGVLPPGLSLHADTGAITGAPTAAVTANFSAQVTDSAANTAIQGFSIIVTSATPPLAVATSALPSGGVGVAYAPGTVLQASGGTSPYTWSIVSGALPAGLGLTADTGAITGTPSAAGDASLTVEVTDSVAVTASQALSITIAPPALTITTAALPAGNLNTAYSGATLQASGGTLPYTWSITAGALPAGLSLDAASGAITGTATAAGVGNFTAEVTDGASATATRPLSIAINDTTPLLFVPVTPCRVADTRNAAGPFGGPALAANSRSFDIPLGACGIPANALAYSLNVTVVPAGPLGYLTIWPTGQPQPLVSTLNSKQGRVKANAAIVPAGANGAVSVYASAATHVVLDINGYFVASPAALAFYPLAPCRVVDTRHAAGPLGGPIMGVAQTRTFALPSGSCGIPGTAQAYSLNFTVVPSGPLGYLTTWPTAVAQPVVSTLNSPAGVVTANAALVPAGMNGAIDVYTSATTHVVIDINGYFAPPGDSGALSFYAVIPCRAVDTRNAAGPLGGPALSGQRNFPLSISFCGLPAGAQAYSLNATVVPKSALGYLTLWPAGAVQPVVSTLNAPDGSTVANAAIVPTLDGAINAYASASTALILDANGYFAP